MKTVKMNSTFRAVALAATLALALPIFGQAAQSRVNIPLGFEMGKFSMPAGQYVFERDSAGWQVYVTDPAGVKRAMMTIPVGSIDAPSHGKLVFERMGQTYRLAEIHLAGSPNGVQIPPTKAQVELAKRQRPVRIEVAMVLK